MLRTSDNIFHLKHHTIARFVVNGLRKNTYIMHDKTGTGIIIDCGVRRETKEERIANYITSNGIKPTDHLITHCHFDHIWGAQWIFDTYGLLPIISPLELNNYTTAPDTLQKMLHRPLPLPLPYTPLTINPSQTYGPLTVIATPGHTQGSLCFYSHDDGVLFSGDTLFKGYVGLPKEPGLTIEQVQSVIDQHIMALPPETLVFPGHGPEFILKDNTIF